jgi:sec-independent protein translocase protein TatA
MPFGFHGLDLVVILVIALLIFGPKKLPEMGSAIGKSIKEFKKGMNELTGAKEDEPKSPTLASYESIERELASRRAPDEANAQDPVNKKVGSSEASSSENVYTERPVD